MIFPYFLGGFPTSMIIRVASGNTCTLHTEESFISLTLIYRPKLDTKFFFVEIWQFAYYVERSFVVYQIAAKWKGWANALNMR